LLLNARVDRRRLPKTLGSGEDEEVDEHGFDLDWLYGVDVVKDVERYIDGL
jgi:hypothetical protein